MVEVFFLLLILGLGAFIMVYSGLLTGRFVQRKWNLGIPAFIAGVVFSLLALFVVFMTLVSISTGDLLGWLMFAALLAYLLWMRSVTKQQTSRRQTAKSGNENRGVSKRLLQDTDKRISIDIDKVSEPMILRREQATPIVASGLSATVPSRTTAASVNLSGKHVEDGPDISGQRPSVLLCGFQREIYRDLEQRAVAAGWQVKGVLDRSVKYVVKGPQAGVLMLTRAEGLGISVIDDTQFYALMTRHGHKE